MSFIRLATGAVQVLYDCCWLFVWRPRRQRLRVIIIAGHVISPWLLRPSLARCLFPLSLCIRPLYTLASHAAADGTRKARCVNTSMPLLRLLLLLLALLLLSATGNTAAGGAVCWRRAVLASQPGAE